MHQIGSSELFLVQKPIREVMSYPLVTVGLTTSVREAIEIMQSRNIRRLLVVDRDLRAQGIVTQKDFIKAFSTSNT